MDGEVELFVVSWAFTFLILPGGEVLDPCLGIGLPLKP